VIESHPNVSHPLDSEQGAKDQSFTVSSLVFVTLGGIEGSLHCDSILNNNKSELKKLKQTDEERLSELALHNETKSLAYLYKLLANLWAQRTPINNTCSDVFSSWTLLNVLKFYLKDGNCQIIFISCILPLQEFSCFSHDWLHNASLVDNVFMKQEYEGVDKNKTGK
jgi:hypothetical protein